MPTVGVIGGGQLARMMHAASIGLGTALSLRPAGRLAAGKAVITVRDRSANDGFRLSGPGLVRATGAAFRGTVSWKVSLKAGR